MELPPLPPKGPNNLSPADRAGSTAELSGLKIGQKVLATITNIAPLSSNQRQQFSQQFNLTASGSASLSQLLSNRELQWLELKAQNQILQVVSAEKLAVQQTVLIEKRTDGHLQLISKLADRVSNGYSSAQNVSNTPTKNTEGKQGFSNQITNHVNKEVSNYRDLLSQTLREVLPKQRPIHNLLNLLTSIDKLLKPLPKQIQNNVLPQFIRHSLQTLQNFALPAEQAIKPAAIKAALQNSGLFLEQKLAYKVTNHKTVETLKPNNVLSNPSQANSNTAAPFAQQDLKATLLTALQLLENISPAVSSSTQSSTSARMDSSGENLLLLLSQLQKLSIKSSTFSETRHQALELIKQHLYSALARIQSQQLQSISKRLSENNMGKQNFFLELPLRIGDVFGFLNMTVEHNPIHTLAEEEKDKVKKQEQKAQQWEVYLEFELEGQGHLMAQLTVLENSIAAKFWADTTHIWQATQNKLEKLHTDLEQAGLQVKDIQCFAGSPPTRKLQLNYSLVDIET